MSEWRDRRRGRGREILVPCRAQDLVAGFVLTVLVAWVAGCSVALTATCR